MSSKESQEFHRASRRPDPLRDQLPRGIAQVARYAPRVLLVVHDHGARNATWMLLKAEGYEVAVAGSLGEALLRVAEQADVQLLITDLWLGNNESGLQVIAAVCRQIARDVKAILLTPDAPARNHNLHCETGLQVVTNPIDVEEFLMLVRMLVATESKLSSAES